MNRSAQQPGRRVRPARIAPLIPVWGLLSFLGVQQLAGTRWFVLFLVCSGVAFFLLFGFVVRQVLSAHRLRRATRKLGDLE